MKLLGIHPMVDGFDLLASGRLDPRLLKDTFAGGVNLTRRAENLRRIRDSLSLYVLASDPKVIMGSRLAIIALKVATGNAVELPSSVHPAVIEWVLGLERKLGDKVLVEMLEGRLGR